MQPHSPTCFAAFIQFSQAAITTFAGRNIVFETVNEPNGMGEVNSSMLVEIALQTAQVKNGEFFVGASRCCTLVVD